MNWGVFPPGGVGSGCEPLPTAETCFEGDGDRDGPLPAPPDGSVIKEPFGS